MDFYPLNLVLAVAVASATIFLGFLPTKNIRSDFFAREILKAGLLWVFIGLTSASTITHYHIIIAIICFGSWWKLHREQALSGKVWLSIASGLSISIGVMFILISTPRAWPAYLSDQERSLLLASVYLGGAIIGLAYVCHVLMKNLSLEAGVTRAMVQRYVGLLGLLVLARAGVLFVSLCLRQPLTPRLIGFYHHDTLYIVPSSRAHTDGWILFALVLIVLPILTFVAMRATRVATSRRADFALMGICSVGFLAEVLARLLAI
jgi:hypothetical protein